MTNASQDLDAEIAELEYVGRRHVGVSSRPPRHGGPSNVQIARLDTKLVALADYTAQLPASADAATLHQVRKATIDVELESGLVVEEARTRLLSELDATPSLIAENAAAIEALKAKASS